MNDIRSSMKALLPFILPLVVLIVLGVVFWQWLQNNSTEPTIDDSAASVQVAEIDQATTTELARGSTADVPSVTMEAPEEAPAEAKDSTATIRYQIKDKTVSLLVLASMAYALSNRVDASSATPMPTAQPADPQPATEVEATPISAAVSKIQSALEAGQKFFVWFKPAGKDTLTKAFELEEGKGGLMGSASIPVEALPMDVYITTTQTMADVPTNTWLKATIPAPASE